ncbi:cytochrome b-c1 complex subunit 9 [Brachionus plicatilis]|uniref:Complex III subunit 9 n=1 Tax=Brachionus plicatilis TaxID=10195 RepID=A0A3M7T0T3_BRAPC|nr:cytochrome b-c1 complex subunit 9 [Brachionus plicatilis]
MALGGQIYTIFFKKSSTYFLTLCAGAFFFERFADGFSDSIFNSINKGKQWHDIKHLYGQPPEEEE